MELRLVDVPTPSPQEHEVVVRMESSPINPSDMGLLFGPADINTVRVAGSGVSSAVSADISAQTMQLVATMARLDVPRFAGYEGVGVGRCLLLPEGTYPRGGCSLFINPLTALGMLETFASQVHTISPSVFYIAPGAQ